MYYIKPQTSDEFFAPIIKYIKVSPTSGCNILCEESEAQGIVVDSVPYSIDENNPIPNAELATYSYIADWTPEIQAKYDAIVRDEAIDKRIKKSKEDLAIYLENNPLTWIDGKQYAVTQEKQNILMGNIAAYQIEVQMNPDAELTWNGTGEECTPWTIENLSVLAVAIKNYVKPLVSYQQAKEVELMNCSTSQEVYDVVIDYNEVNK